MSLNIYQKIQIQNFIGRDITAGEEVYFSENCNPDTGFFEIDPRPNPGRMNLVFYTACTGVQMRDYIRKHRPEVHEQYQLHHVMAHSLSLRCAVEGHKFREIVSAIFRNADAMIYNPVDAGYEGLSDRDVIRQVRPDCKLASFGGPHHGCWWVICPFFGEEPVFRLFDRGATNEQVWELITTKTFNPCFEERWREQMAFMKGYQHATDVRLTDFIQDEHRKCKMFFTFNHPTCHVLAFCADECLAEFGFERKGREHAISVVPADDMMVGEVYPETDYEWEYYKLEYPQRWVGRMGGIEFYRTVLPDVRNRWKGSNRPKFLSTAGSDT